MNIWENTVITEKGLSLQAKLIKGTSLIITRAVSGTGYVTPALLQKQTAISGEKQALAFRTVTYPAVGKCAVPVVLKNEGLTNGYTATQIGIYAMDPDDGEILYLISQAENGTGTEVPSEAEVASYSASWTFYMQYGHADNVTVVVDPSDAVTAELLEAHLVSKANVDLTNVTNNHFLVKAIQSGAANPIATTTGTGAAYLAELPGVTELYPGLAFTMIPHVTSTTNAPTLNINGLGAKPIRQPLTTNTSATTTAELDTWLSQSVPVRVMYNGSLWRIDIPRTSASSVYGAVKVENGGTGGTTVQQAQNNLGIIRIVEVLATLTAAGWSGSAAPYTQVVTINGMKSDTPGIARVNYQAATLDQRNAARNALLCLTAQAEGKVTITADGELPTVDIPIVVRMDLKEVTS